MERRRPGEVSREGSGGGAADAWGTGCGARHGPPEAIPPPWETGVLSQGGGGAGDPRSLAGPEAEPSRPRLGGHRLPGVRGVRGRPEGSRGPLRGAWTPRPTAGPLTRALTGLVSLGTEKEDVSVPGVGPWPPGQARIDAPFPWS